jgi:hypothetical protein
MRGLWDKAKAAGSALKEGVGDAVDELKPEEKFTIEELQDESREHGICLCCGAKVVREDS